MIVYTAIYGGKDKLLPPKVPLDKSVKLVCFTDEKSELTEAAGWETIVVSPRFGDARMSAKW